MSRLNNILNGSNGTNGVSGSRLSSLIPSKSTNNAIVNTPTANTEATQNNGGFFSGLGYLGEKIGLGFLSGIEGIWDYTAGGIAKLFGDDDWAEQQFASDWVNYNHADEWFNPSSSWQTAGDVAGGIGTSLPALAGAATGATVIYLSGGTLSGVGAKLILGSISAGIAGFGAAGNATKEAYRETGELTGKEFGYGALSGVTEAGIEFATAGIGKGTGRIISSLGKTAAKETAETVAKTGAKAIFKQIGEDFVTEAFEEGLAEFLSPVYQRMTYNPDAENASAQEIFYAAMVGGLSGMVMSGSSIGINAGVNTTVNYFSGKKASESGTYAGVIEAGRALADAESKNDTGIEAFQSAQDTYNKLTESLKKNNGISTTEELLERVKAGNVTFKAKDLMYLGKLKRTSVIAHLHPYIEKSARGLVFNAENAAQRYASFGMTDANGKPIRVTAEQILSGIDASLVEKAKAGTLTDTEAKTFAKSLRKALSENSTLATLAVAEATGGIMMDTRRMAEAMLNGENLANTADLNRLIEKGKPEEMQALGQALGIEDWSKVTIDELRTKVAQFNESGGISEFAEQSKRMRRALEQGAESAKPLPHLLRKNMQDGVYRYTSEDGSVNMAIFKEGDTYRLYDYDGGNISRALSVQDVNQVLRRFWTSGQTTTAKSMQFTEETNLARETTEIDAYAAKNIPDYNSMSEPNKAAIRMTVRQARAHGLADAETLVFAKVAAKSGLNVIFDAERAFGDGAISGNTIYVNPNNSEARTYEVILGHEMFHKLFAEGDKRALQLFTEARDLLERSNPEKAQEVRERYKKFYKKLGTDATTAHTISEEEVAAAGAEEVFRSADAWAYILSKEPSFADKVLSFFRKSAREYSSIQGLSAQARKFVRQYKALFESLSERNQGNNALSIALEGAGAKKMPVTNTNSDSVHVTGDNDEEAPIVTNTDERHALPEALKSLGEYDATRIRHIESSGKDRVVRDYNEIKDFIKRSKSNPPFERLHIGIISDKTAALVKARTGEDITGYDFVLASNFVFHIYDSHGNEATEAPRGQKAVDDVNIENIIEAVIDPDDVSLVSDSTGTALRFEKFLEGRNVAITITSTKKSTLTLKSAWIINEKSGGRTPSANANALAGTPEANSRSSTDNSITENAEKSNPSDEKSAKKSSKKRFALTDEAYAAAIESGDMETLANYTQKQYNSFGWARYAEALTKTELDDLYSKIQARTTLRTFKQSSKGEAIIEVNKKPHTTLDVDNVFVFVKGTKNNFEITRVVKFAAETETEMEILKEKLYERGTCSDTYLALYKKEGLTREYRREDSPTFAAYREGRINGKTSGRVDTNNRQSRKYRSGYSLTVGEDGEITERYALTDEENWGDIIRNMSAELGSEFNINAVLERGLPRKPGAATLTIGEIKKTIANNTHYKVYSKKTALDVIGKMYGISDISQKTRSELADALWQGFNDCTDIESRQTFAHDMAEFIVAKMITEAKVENPDIMEAQERLSYLSTYIGKISFHPEYLSEIRHIADKAGLKKILGRWGYKGKKGTNRVPMEVFVCDIAREMPGMSALEDMHPVEAFMELDAMYERAREDVKDKWISAYWDMPDSDIAALVAGIEADIMKAFETEGEESKFSKLVEGRIEYYSTRAEFWKAEHDKIIGRDRILGLLMNQAQKMKNLKLGTFSSATQFDSELFKNSIEKLAKIQFRGNLNVSGTRKIMGELLQWYRKDNPLLEFVDEKNSGLYVQGVADMLQFLSEGEKGFSKEELLTMYDVMSYFVKFVENYGKVFRNGKMIEALPEAQRYIGIAQANEGLKVGLFAKLAGSWYAEMFNDPAAVVHRMDYYGRGFYTEMFEDLREASVDAEIAEMRIMREYDEFLRSNKKYIEKACEELIEYRGQKIPKIQLIDLYMTMKRKHAWAGIAINGFPFKNLEGKAVRVPGFVIDEHISETELEAAISAQRAEIAKHFTEADRQYMAILEKGYNEDARKLKADRDMQRLGFTNATTDYYYPIRRAYTAQNIDTSDAQAEYDRVTNSSFNKDIVRGAKQEIAIESADARFRRHIHAVCQYAYLSPAIETFNRLYNMDTSGNRNHPVSVRTASENVWTKGNKYFMKLISDIQGIPTGSSEGMAALSFIRGSYAKFQLGANPKVWFTQLSSIFASSSILDADSIKRGAFISSKGIDEYCPLAELRSYDNTAAMAQGVLDKQGKARSKAGRAMGKVSKFSDLLMQPIGMMDRFVVCRVFGACQAQVEKNGGAKVGTEANKIEAGKLLKKVILETQQNSIATERSAAMRSGNEILRTVTMFTSDSMKVIGRVVDAFGEISVLHAKIKAATNPDVKAELKARLKAAKRNARKATTALVLTAVFMASIAQVFRWLYDKEKKEDETVAQTMVVDAVGNLFGGLPLIKDVYARIFEGYGFDNYAYSSINDLLDSAINLFDTADSIIGGEASSQDVARGIKNLSYSIGQITGLPSRNVYNVFYGLTKRFNPETAYKIDSAFYAKNYQNDLYKAIEDEDAEMASYILSLLYNERMGADISEAVHNELYSLSAKGYKVLPKSAPKSITVEGAEYELNEAQQAAVRGSYSASQDSLEKLFTKEKYKKLTNDTKAEAVNYVYDLHYNMALEDALGVDRGNAVLISSVIGAENLAMLHVATKGLTSDTDKLGNTISGSKRQKVVAAINTLDISKEQKLLLICAKGYSLKDGDLRGLSAERAKKLLLRYIFKIEKLNKQQKSELASMCGFEVKNGRIVLQTSS